MSGELNRLRTVSPTDNDGGCGHDVQWAVAEIERLQPTPDCGWKQHTPCGFWITDCGEECDLGRMTLADSQYEFCPYCSGKIIEESSE